MSKKFSPSLGTDPGIPPALICRFIAPASMSTNGESMRFVANLLYQVVLDYHHAP